MIKGMTGFGHVQISVAKLKANIEIKTLNHRYFDISYYLPPGFGPIESKIRQIIERHIERGKINVAIKLSQKSSQVVNLNKDVAKMYLKHARQLKNEFGLKNDVSLSDLLRFPGVFEISENVVGPEDLWSHLEKGINKAMQGVNTMRQSEGRALVKDITDKLGRMLAQIKIINQKTKNILKDKKKTITAEEFASFQKNNDVNEELTRLSHYISELKSLLRNGVSVGKKIDFIAQEMQRETNTIGSKVQDKIVSNAVIALKSKIEKIREQAQNIE